MENAGRNHAAFFAHNGALLRGGNVMQPSFTARSVGHDGAACPPRRGPGGEVGCHAPRYSETADMKERNKGGSMPGPQAARAAGRGNATGLRLILESSS